MHSNTHLATCLNTIFAWDWSNVEKLKAAIERVRDSGNSVFLKSLEQAVEDIAYNTERRTALPAYKRPIIAVDKAGYALTGTLDSLKVERIPYDPAGHR
jgi:hypothetical protein